MFFFQSNQQRRESEQNNNNNIVQANKLQSPEKSPQVQIEKKVEKTPEVKTEVSKRQEEVVSASKNGGKPDPSRAPANGATDVTDGVFKVPLPKQDVKENTTKTVEEKPEKLEVKKEEKVEELKQERCSISATKTDDVTVTKAQKNVEENKVVENTTSSAKKEDGREVRNKIFWR